MSTIPSYNQALSEFLIHLKTKQRAKNTLLSYESDLKKFYKYLQTSHLNYEQTTDRTLSNFQQYLLEHSSDTTNTIRRVVIAVRQFFSFLESSGYIGENDVQYSKVPERLDDLPFQLTDEQIENLLLQINGTSLKSLRDRAMILILATSGINVTELCDLKWINYILKDSTSALLHIVGKRERTVPLKDKCVQAINKYRDAIPSSFTYPNLLLSFRGNRDEEVMPQISRHGVKHIINFLGQRAGIPQLSPQMFRHFAAISWIEAGVEIYQVAEYLGVRSVHTTDKYLEMLGITKPTT